MSEIDNNNIPLATSSPVTNNNETSAGENGNVADSNSVSSTASVSSVDNVPPSGPKIASGVKPTGIKPPSTLSRIGRPCGNQHKPAVPTTPPRSNSSDDSIKRITDDYGRHRLTDVLEENEEDGFGRSFNYPSIRKRYSSTCSNASSMDYLWDVHPRRLSEAGLSRHADSSTILTEDTDSFIIGQRVWVSGTKPGHIAYIGETQFAPGDWAGIALDEPIGKNDGSVGGIHYFQCEPKKGVFSRLTRLTRVPLAQEGMGSGDTYVTSTPSPVGNGMRRGPISPTGSTKSLMKSPVSISGSNNSLASSYIIDYKVGDRVIIKSSQGSKVGTVRYIGTTEFANGEWVGVELDDPRGKNDGSVHGKRYFECKPNFGLFAPASKVSKSPSKVRPSACQVHSGSGLPTGLKRSNSKESMQSNLSLTSAASSVRRVRLGVTSLTPKDVLKEKQQHIEQLLKERDLERVEITRAASIADEAEQQLATLRQEYEKYRAECDIKLQEHMNLLNKLKEDRIDLVSQLEDEKRKNEDLLFRLEEASITKDDIEKKILAESVTNEGNVSKIKELEEQLSKERDKVDNLESETNKLFEVEENLCKAKEELESLRSQLQETRNKQLSLEGDSATTSVLIASIQKEADQYKTEVEEKIEMVTVLKQEISKLTSEMKKNLDETESKVSALESNLTNKDKEKADLKTELEHISKLAQEKVEALERVTTEKLDTETALEKEIERLKMQVSSKTLDAENLSDEVKVKDTTITDLQKKLETLTAELQQKNENLEQYKGGVADLETGLNQEIDSLKAQLIKKSTEYDEIVAERSNEVMALQKKMEESNNTITANYEEIKILTGNLENLKKSFEGDTTELQVNFKKEMEEKEGKVNQLTTELKQITEENAKTTENYNKIKTEYTTKCEELDKLKLLLETTKKELENSLSTKTAELQKMSELLKEKEDQIQMLQTELQTTKVDLESVSNNLVQYQNNLSDVEVSLKKERDKIKETLKVKIVESEEAKKEFSVKLSEKEKQVEELTTVLASKTEEVTKLVTDLNNLKESQESAVKNMLEEHSKNICQREEKLASLSTEIQNKNREVKSLSSKLQELENSDKEKNLIIENLRKEMDEQSKQRESESETVSKLNEEVKQLCQVREELTAKGTELEKVRVTLENSNKLQEEDMKVLNNQLADNAENIKQKDEVIKAQENELAMVKSSLEKTSNDLIQYQNNLSDTEATLKAERDDAWASLQAKTLELQEVKKDLSEKVSNFEASLEAATETIRVKNEDVVKLNNEINKLKSENENLVKETIDKYEKQFESLEIKVSDLLKEMENKDAEISKLSNSVTIFEEEVNEKNKLMDALRVELETTKKGRQTSEDNVLKLNQKIEELEASGDEFQKLLMESTKQLNELFSKKEKAEDDLKSVVSAAGDANTKFTEMTKQLQEKDVILETTRSEFQSKLESVENTVKNLTESKSNLEKAMEAQRVQYEEKLKGSLESEETLRDIIAAASADSDKIKELQKNLENARTSLADKDKQLVVQNSEILKLKNDLIKVQSQQNNVNGVTETSDPNSTGTNSKTDYKQLLEEKIFAENQVAFLNSIIVDMQKKNEEQKARIEILEMGYSSSAADELAALGFKTDKKLPAPRMYCDICEEFDLHETEDCPTQGEDEPPPVNHHLGEPKEEPPPRSYCEICGVFGHTTEECTEDQEF